MKKQSVNRIKNMIEIKQKKKEEEITWFSSLFHMKTLHCNTFFIHFFLLVFTSIFASVVRQRRNDKINNKLTKANVNKRIGWLIILIDQFRSISTHSFFFFFIPVFKSLANVQFSFRMSSLVFVFSFVAIPQ